MQDLLHITHRRRLESQPRRKHALRHTADLHLERSEDEDQGRLGAQAGELLASCRCGSFELPSIEAMRGILT